MPTQSASYSFYKEALHFAKSNGQEKFDHKLAELREQMVKDAKLVAHATGLSIKVTDASEGAGGSSHMPKYINENGVLEMKPIDQPDIVYHCDAQQGELRLSRKNALAVKDTYKKLTHNELEEKLHVDGTSMITLHNVSSPKGIGELLARSGIQRQTQTDYAMSRW